MYFVLWYNSAEYGRRVTPTLAGLSIHTEKPKQVDLRRMGVDLELFEGDLNMGPSGKLTLSELSGIPTATLAKALHRLEETGECFIDLVEIETDPSRRDEHLPPTTRVLHRQYRAV